MFANDQLACVKHYNNHLTNILEVVVFEKKPIRISLNHFV